MQMKTNKIIIKSIVPTLLFSLIFLISSCKKEDGIINTSSTTLISFADEKELLNEMNKVLSLNPEE